MSRLHVLFFDVGDTLVFDDPPIGARFALAAREAGYGVDATRLPDAWQLAEHVGLEAYMRGLDTDDPGVQRRSAAAALGALGHCAPSDAQWRDLGRAFVSVPFARSVPPQAVALLEMLRGRGVRLGVISDWNEALPAVLDGLGLGRYFETASVSSVVGCRKPDARLFQHALMQMNVLPADALHIGDWLELDVRGAQGVGMRAVLFDHAGRAPDADCVRVETFPALAAYLDALTASS